MVTGASARRPLGTSEACAEVELAMTIAAHGHQVVFCIKAAMAASDDMVDLQLIATSALLAFPSVAIEDACFERAVLLRIEPKPSTI